MAKRKRSRSPFLKTGTGLSRIPMAGLRSLEKAGTRFSQVTGKVDSELKKIRKEIRLRSRKK